MTQDAGPRILLVEDDNADREKTLEALRKHGLRYEARFVTSSHEALDYLAGRGRFHERSRYPMPDLVLLDISLAPMDGLRVLARIREVEALQPVSPDDMRDLLRMTYPSPLAYAAMRFE